MSSRTEFFKVETLDGRKHLVVSREAVATLEAIDTGKWLVRLVDGQQFQIEETMLASRGGYVENREFLLSILEKSMY